MKRTIKSYFNCSRDDLNRLFACNRISALVWNKILELQREKLRSKGDLQKALKGLYPISSQSVQAVTDKYCAACLATKSAKDNGLANKYPWRRKINFPTTWKADGFKLSGNRLRLSLGTFAGHRQKPIEVKLPKSILASVGNNKIQQITLIWDGWLKLAIIIEDGKEVAPAVQSDVTCGIDLGEIHSITAFEKSGNAIIITGRLLRSVKQYQLKKLAEFSKKLSKCKTNSRRYKKLRRAKRRMLEKTNAQIRDLNHKITRSFVTWAIENNVSKVYVGNPEGVQRKKCRKIVSQKLSRWNFGKHLEYLGYKLAAVGIELEKISEAYSTQTCPRCGRRNKCKSRNYRCSCGYVAHRDIHGARNILSLGTQGRICITTPIKETKYLRTA